MIKLVASDLDGTLLHNYQQTVPKEIYDTIKALHEKGIIFTAASGRQYANIRRLFAPLLLLITNSLIHNGFPPHKYVSCSVQGDYAAVLKSVPQCVRGNTLKFIANFVPIYV